jgi:hypothetical protein
MRHAIFGALILSLQLVGVSVAAAAVPANGSPIAKTNLSSDVIQVGGGCGKRYWRNPKTGKCEP